MPNGMIIVARNDAVETEPVATFSERRYSTIPVSKFYDIYYFESLFPGQAADKQQ